MLRPTALIGALICLGLVQSPLAMAQEGPSSWLGIWQDNEVDGDGTYPWRHVGGETITSGSLQYAVEYLANASEPDLGRICVGMVLDTRWLAGEEIPESHQVILPMRITAVTPGSRIQIELPGWVYSSLVLSSSVQSVEVQIGRASGHVVASEPVVKTQILCGYPDDEWNISEGSVQTNRASWTAAEAWPQLCDAGRLVIDLDVQTLGADAVAGEITVTDLAIAIVIRDGEARGGATLGDVYNQALTIVPLAFIAG